jgi:topoisomerase IA-like protein
VEEVSQAHSASLQQQQQQFQVELDSLKTLLKETKARGEARLHRQVSEILFFSRFFMPF